MVDSPQRLTPTTARASFWLWITSVISVILVVLTTIAAAVLMFVPASSAFFRSA